MAVYNERVKVNTNHVNRSCITNESSRSKKKDLFEADPPQKEGVGVGGEETSRSDQLGVLKQRLAII